MTTFVESTMEVATLDWLEELGYSSVFGLEIAFDVGAIHTLTGTRELPQQPLAGIEIKNAAGDATLDF